MNDQYADSLLSLTRTASSRSTKLFFVILLMTAIAFIKLVSWHWGPNSVSERLNDSTSRRLPIEIRKNDSLLVHLNSLIEEFSTDSTQTCRMSGVILQRDSLLNIQSNYKLLFKRLDSQIPRYEEALDQKHTEIPILGLSINVVDLPILLSILMPMCFSLLLISVNQLGKITNLWNHFIEKSKESSDKYIMQLLLLRSSPLFYSQRLVAISIISGLMLGILAALALSYFFEYQNLISTYLSDPILLELIKENYGYTFIVKGVFLIGSLLFTGMLSLLILRRTKEIVNNTIRWSHFIK